MSKVVTGRARRFARRLVDSVLTESVDSQTCLPLLREAKALGDEAAPALVELMNSDDPGEMLTGAWGVLLATEEDPDVVDKDASSRAEALMLTALTEGLDEWKHVACVLLRAFGVREVFAPALEALMTHADPLISVLAAVVHYQISPRSRRTVDRLRLAMQEDNDLLAGFSAIALLRGTEHRQEAVSWLYKRMPGLGETGLYQLALTAKYLGPKAAPLFDLFVSLLHDSRYASTIRWVVASAIGRMGMDKKKTASVLFDLLVPGDVLILDGAIDGLRENGYFPPQTGERLVRLLSDADEEIRGTASIGLGAMGSAALPCLDAMISQYEQEPSFVVCKHLADAIAATGEKGIAALVTFLNRHDVQRTEFVMRAIAARGNRGAETLVRLYPEVKNANVQKIITMTLCAMTSRVASAIELMGRILDDTNDDETAMHVSMGLYACGRHAKAATPALVRCVLDERPEESRSWAERALVEIGGAAVEELSKIGDALEGNLGGRARSLLLKVVAANSARFVQYAQFDDEVLEMFVRVVELFLSRQGRISIKQMPPIFERERNEGRISFPPSENSLRSGIRRLEGGLGVTLISRRGGQKGRLTTEARELLPEVRACLEFRRSQHKAAIGS